MHDYYMNSKKKSSVEGIMWDILGGIYQIIVALIVFILTLLLCGFVEMWRMRKSREMYCIIRILLFISVMIHALNSGYIQLLFLLPPVLFLIVMGVKNKIFLYMCSIKHENKKKTEDKYTLMKNKNRIERYRAGKNIKKT